MRNGFTEDPVARQLGLGEWLDNNDLDFDAAAVRTQLRELHAAGEASAGAACGTARQHGPVVAAGWPVGSRLPHPRVRRSDQARPCTGRLRRYASSLSDLGNENAIERFKRKNIDAGCH